MRKTLRTLIVGAFVIVGLSACSDKTVTSAPPTTNPSSVSVVTEPGAGSSSGAATGAADDARLTEVDHMLKEIEADLQTADQDAATPEGDPTR